jgi:GDP-4-dehydro-6-deoxy-D-mannose reductase
VYNSAWMRVLITGITGFVGSHMAEYALARGAEVFGSTRWRSRTENIEHLRSKIRLIECDLRDLASVRGLLETVEPTHVIHLAAQSFVGASWQTPAETLSTNILSQVNLLEGIRRLTIAPRVLVVGSSEEYGLVEPGELPIRETNPLRPLSPYAVSKVAQDMMGYQYFKSYGLPIVRTRAFNHEGPRRGEVFVTSNFAKQIAEIEAGLREPLILVGDLKPRRDFSDVRDIVHGYWLLLERGEPGEVYNLCSGRSWAIQQVLDILVDQSRVKGIAVETDPARLRPSDVMVLEGDPSKMRKATGWQVEIPFERTLKDLLAYWRQRTMSSPR